MAPCARRLLTEERVERSENGGTRAASSGCGLDLGLSIPHLIHSQLQADGRQTDGRQTDGRSGPVTGYVTLEYWQNWQREAIGVMCLPTSSQAIIWDGEAPQPAAKQIAAAKAAISPAALKKFGPTLTSNWTTGTWTKWSNSYPTAPTTRSAPPSTCSTNGQTETKGKPRGRS